MVMRPAQAMVETVIAVSVLSTLFFGALWLSRILQTKIVLDYAASRAARARSVGLNDFMCRKTALAAAIPISGRRLWPVEDDDAGDELSRMAIYLVAGTADIAAGVLDYERWHDAAIDFRPSLDRIVAEVALKVEGVRWHGRAEIEAHAPFYLGGN